MSVSLFRKAVAPLLFVITAGAALASASPTAQTGSASVTQPGAGSVTQPGSVPAELSIAEEVSRLRVVLNRDVPRAISADAWNTPAWTEAAKAALEKGGAVIDHPQLVVVVDRAVSVQTVAVMLARPDAAWEIIGGAKVSTGQPGRKEHFLTPTGVFVHDTAILDYRAEGTFNGNHIRGLGVKGMRVWDFGWRTTMKFRPPDRETIDIRLLMHATDPDVLESRLGRPASKGCVRVSGAMNRFLDGNGILDAGYEHVARNSARHLAVLRRDRTPTPLAGSMLIVIDSSGAPGKALVERANAGVMERATSGREGVDSAAP